MPAIWICFILFLIQLKYFCEDAPEFAVVGAGSLLGVAMSRGVSFPVGKVDFIRVYPVTFSEFLSEADAGLYQYLEQISTIDSIPDILFSRLTDKLKMYFISGGMPEAVVTLLDTRDVEETRRVIQNILNSYTLDFSKYVDNRDVNRIHSLWNSLPSQLARENKKFVYHSVKSGARAREYEDALSWLINAGFCYRIWCSSKPGLPWYWKSGISIRYSLRNLNRVNDLLNIPLFMVDFTKKLLEMR